MAPEAGGGAYPITTPFFHGLGSRLMLTHHTRLTSFPHRVYPATMTTLATKKYLDIPPQLVLEIAYGVEKPEIIAERHGFSSSEWNLLKQHEPFVKQVDAKKAELKASGYTFRMKSAIAAEDILEDVYKKAKQEDASFHTQLESLKFFARAAGLETPPKAEVESGPAFSITIHLGGGQSVQIGAEKARQPAQNDAQDVFTVEMDEDQLPSVPTHLRSAAIDLNLEVMSE